VKRTVFGRGRITILGSLPLEGATPRGLPVRIEGDIAKGSKRRWTQGERFGSWVPTPSVAIFWSRSWECSPSASCSENGKRIPAPEIAYSLRIAGPMAQLALTGVTWDLNVVQLDRTDRRPSARNRRDRRRHAGSRLRRRNRQAG
jgi:hypothetical protein